MSQANNEADQRILDPGTYVERIKAAFDRRAESSYDRETDHWHLPTAQTLVDQVALSAGQRVLDVATGTGIVAELAGRSVGPGGSVLGTDVSSGMISQVGVQWCV